MLKPITSLYLLAIMRTYPHQWYSSALTFDLDFCIWLVQTFAPALYNHCQLVLSGKHTLCELCRGTRLEQTRGCNWEEALKMSYDPSMYTAQLADRPKEAQNYLWSHVAPMGHKLASRSSCATRKYVHMYSELFQVATLQCVLLKSCLCIWLWCAGADMRLHTELI